MSKPTEDEAREVSRRIPDEHRAPGLLTKREEDALAYVDKGLDNIKGGEYVWSNAEVVELLEDIRSILLTGEIAPGGFDWPDTPEAVDAHYRACNPESGELESADAPGGDS